MRNRSSTNPGEIFQFASPKLLPVETIREESHRSSKKIKVVKLSSRPEALKMKVMSGSHLLPPSSKKKLREKIKHN